MTGTKENYELISAISQNDTTNVIKYLDQGCCPNPTGQYESSPLMTALDRFYIDLSIFKYLLEFGADPNLEDYLNRTPFKEALKKQNKPVVKLMLEHKADPNKSSVMEPSPFEEVVRRGDIEFIKLLIEHGADINLPNRDGQTPLEIAFLMKDQQVVNTLKYYGAVLPGLSQDESQIDNPAFDLLMNRLEGLESELEDARTQLKILEQQNKIIKSDMADIREQMRFNARLPSAPPAKASIVLEDYADSDNYEEDEDSELDNDWDYQKKDKTCVMCAGTGFMGAAEGEEDDTGCDEVTCPYCQGAGIE